MEREVYEVQTWFEVRNQDEADELQSRIENVVCDFMKERGRKLNYGIVGDYTSVAKARAELELWDE